MTSIEEIIKEATLDQLKAELSRREQQAILDEAEVEERFTELQKLYVEKKITRMKYLTPKNDPKAKMIIVSIKKEV